jgi:hypothetical protein
MQSKLLRDADESVNRALISLLANASATSEPLRRLSQTPAGARRK